MSLSTEQKQALYRNLVRADHFNRMMYRRMMQGKLIGFYHPAEGAIAPGVGACTFLNQDDPIVIVVEDGRLEEAVTRLGRIGFDHVAGYLDGGMAALADRPDRVAQLERTTVPELDELAMQGEEVQRQADEAGLFINPLGLTGSSLLFDISPAELADGKTHYEQVYERGKPKTEFAKTGGIFEMCQLWVNLPKKYKMQPPRYQPILSGQALLVSLEPEPEP